MLVCVPTVSASGTCTTGHLVSNKTGPSGLPAGRAWPWLHGAGAAEPHRDYEVVALTDTSDEVMLGNWAVQLTAVALLFQWFLHQWLLLKGDYWIDRTRFCWDKWTRDRGKVIQSARLCGKRRLKGHRRRRFRANLHLSWSRSSVWSALKSHCDRWWSVLRVPGREFFN